MIKGTKGFTLMEILVVVLIISILAGIAMPQYKSMQKKAEVINLYSYMGILERDLVNHRSLHGVYPKRFSSLPSISPDIAATAEWGPNSSLIRPEVTKGGFIELAPDRDPNSNLDFTGASAQLVAYLRATSDPNRCSFVCQFDKYGTYQKRFNCVNGQGSKIAKSFGWKKLPAGNFEIK